MNEVVTKDEVMRLLGCADGLRLSVRQQDLVHFLAGRQNPVPQKVLCAGTSMKPQTLNTMLYKLRPLLWAREYNIVFVPRVGYRLTKFGDAE
ncbi:MAG: hypothetical protein V3U60_16630 [Gammaproteobacteria bacterium]